MSNQVDMPAVLSLGTGMTPAQCRNAIVKGDVYVNQWNIGRPEVVMERSALANAKVRCKDHEFQINALGNAIVRQRQERPQTQLVC